MKPRIVFDDNAKKDILEMFGKQIKEDGAIIEKANPEQQVLTPGGEEITIDNFGGIKKGSEIFIKKDVVSLLRLLKK